MPINFINLTSQVCGIYRLILLHLFVLTFSGCSPFAGQNPHHGSRLTTDRREFLEDPTGTLTVDQILAEANLERTIIPLNSVISFGFSDSVIWGRFDLRSDRSVRAIVEIPSTRLDRVDWFEVRGGVISRTVPNGLRAAPGVAPLDYPSLTVDIEPGLPVTVLCRIQSLGSLTIPLLIATEDDWRRVDQHRRFLSYAQIGGSLVVVLIVLLLSLLFLDWSFALLAMSCCFILAYGLVFDNVVSLPGISLSKWCIRTGSSLMAVFAAVSMLGFTAIYTGFSDLTKQDKLIFFVAMTVALLFCSAHFLLPFRQINRMLSGLQTIVVTAALWISSAPKRRYGRRENLILFWTLILCHAPAALLMLQLLGWISIGSTPSSLRFVAMPVIFCSLFVVLLQRRQAMAELRLNTALAQAGEADARLLALRLQLNPHMLMNSLTAISWMATECPLKIPRFIENLSCILQSRLRPSTGQFWEVAAEIQLAENLLELATVRFGDRVRHSTSVSAEAARCLLPEMLVQPLVENAIKYCPLDLPLAEIRIVAELQHNRLMITVENSNKPGTTGNVSEGLRIGHANIRQRLDLLYHKSAHFRFSVAESVVTAQLELPIVTTVPNS